MVDVEPVVEVVDEDVEVGEPEVDDVVEVVEVVVEAEEVVPVVELLLPHAAAKAQVEAMKLRPIKVTVRMFRSYHAASSPSKPIPVASGASAA